MAATILGNNGSLGIYYWKLINRNALYIKTIGFMLIFLDCNWLFYKLVMIVVDENTQQLVINLAKLFPLLNEMHDYYI